MRPDPATRRLDWPGCRNARDLGGLPTADGGAIRTGALIRADSLQHLTPDATETVRQSGVSRILDLRSHGEVTGFPTPFTGDSLGLHLSLQDPADPPSTATTIVESCTEMLDRHPELVAAALLAIVEAPPGAVVVHCVGGKDRTGVIVALALAVAGVPEDEIVADYFLTQENLAPLLAEQLAAEPDTSQHAWLVEFRDTRAESMTAILRHLDTTYGGPVAYLRHAGLTEEQLAALRARLTA
ncbi:protein tyrosine/serine phosphatase [Kribbella flavida DSM 17836]|uniref:Protein tyrosine/serine phosphatase n=1 Tax=Kribbella flavida (strain DSM 17836 / JCM 10339 / NBRC 14399) TaxID=479435 RepID=D2PLN7_KRIFD|nr:tyrosine-protein phosphatase [Kribbella flavida]ADB30666.1 protein tyrosine/serine phosphatase [Kribbella flavida DSM 17836]